MNDFNIIDDLERGGADARCADANLIARDYRVRRPATLTEAGARDQR